VIRAGVPGKLLLAGEYSVLVSGRAALVAAVDRRLFVEGTPASRWSARSGDALWTEGEAVPAGLSFVVAAIDAVRKRWDPRPLALTTRDELTVDGHKLGLGGSAAATVGAVFAAAQGAGSGDALWRVADEVHRAVQGVTRYRREPLSVERVPVHPEVRLVAVWTGASVKTSPRLARWNAFVAEKPAEARTFCELSDASVNTLSQGLRTGEMGLIRAGVGQGRAALKGLEDAMGLELETPALKLASDVAWQVGAAGKLSGSGGGDCAVVLAMGDGGARDVLAELRNAGLEAFLLGFAKGGVHVEGD
jgi:phosphomevalonate kinase